MGGTEGGEHLHHSSFQDRLLSLFELKERFIGRV